MCRFDLAEPGGPALSIYPHDRTAYRPPPLVAAALDDAAVVRRSQSARRTSTSAGRADLDLTASRKSPHQKPCSERVLRAPKLEPNHTLGVLPFARSLRALALSGVHVSPWFFGPFAIVHLSHIAFLASQTSTVSTAFTVSVASSAGSFRAAKSLRGMGPKTVS